MVTETFHNYKGWDFKIRAVTSNGIWSTIFRDISTINPNSPTGMKRIHLREKGWSFKYPDVLIAETKTFIDNHESNLIMSLNKKKEQYEKRLSSRGISNGGSY